MKLRDGRKISITFQVCEVKGHIMSVGKFCTKGIDRCATFTTRGGVLWHEEAGEVVGGQNWNAGSNQETCWHQCTWPAPVEAQVNLPGILRHHHNEQTRKSLWTCSPKELTHQELTKNTLSPKAFR